MVVDLKKFTPGNTALTNGLLVIGEQYPGYYKVADVTHVLAKQTYWPSYNVPYFPSSFALGGTTVPPHNLLGLTNSFQGTLRW